MAEARTVAPVPATIWTIGHSTRSAEDFVSLLRHHGIQTLVDVRRYPASRRYPHFNREQLAATLAGVAIGYEWIESLGGRRGPAPDSPNTAWRNAAFQGYADHMGSREFAAGFAALCAIASKRPTALMCSEAVWWRCHRGLISDLLRSRGAKVLHIMDDSEPGEHPWTPAARLHDGLLTYDSRRGEQAARLRVPSPQASLL